MSRILLVGALASGAGLSGAALAQSDREIRYPDGTVVQPLPVVPSMMPRVDLDVTGSVTPLVPADRGPGVNESVGAGPSGRCGCRVQC